MIINSTKSSNFVDKTWFKLKMVSGQLRILLILSFILEWRHSTISFSHKSCFCNFSWKALEKLFSSLELKPRKCVFRVWGHHKLLHTIVWRYNFINFYWQCCFRTSYRIVPITRFWTQNKETSLPDSNDVIMTSQRIPKLM